ncbi:MAG: CPBP family intramembrane metalloprotease [Phycisphaerales bacterium]|nr:MAG: CPBP family intramembrane metalloprotease [Phycisphaerales bacterium]
MVRIERSKPLDWRLFGGLLAVAVAGQAAALPYVLTLFETSRLSLPVPLAVAVLVQIVQGTVLSAVAILLGLRMAKGLGLGLPFAQDWLDHRLDRARFGRTVILSIGLGAIAGAAIFVLDRFAFALLAEPITAMQETPPLWQRVLVSFYGGINEEIFLRLFLMTFLIWLGAKLTRRTVPAALTIWVAIIAVSIVFGLGHLPMIARLTALTPVVVARALVLNGIAGVLFGWLYWRRGLEAAMIAHFTTDIVLHVLLPSVV